MPIYEYLCSACEHRADIVHGINDPGPKFCPSCGREGTLRKQWAAPTVHYKGSGWAKKDRGGSSSSRRSASTGGSDEAKSDIGSTGESSATSGGTAGSSSGDSPKAGSD